EAAGQFVEQRGQAPLRDDGLRDRQQGPVLPAGGRAVSFEVAHGSRPPSHPAEGPRLRAWRMACLFYPPRVAARQGPVFGGRSSAGDDAVRSCVDASFILGRPTPMKERRELPRLLRAAYFGMHRVSDAHFSRHGLTADQFVLLACLADEDAIT